MVNNLVIFTGAGISAESGIPTFRSGNTALWANYDVMTVASTKGLEENPNLVNKFYNERRVQLFDVEPNAAHYAIVELEKKWKDGFIVITSNVDDLHIRAGTNPKKIIHIHGELMKIRCTQCEEIEETLRDVSENQSCKKCGAGIMRPHVCFFGEMPFYLDYVEKILDKTDIFVSIGSSGSVMPASLFPNAVAMNVHTRGNPRIIEINPDPSGNEVFTEVRKGNATIEVPKLVEELIKQYC